MAEGPKLTVLGKAFIALFMGVLAWGAWELFNRNGGDQGEGGVTPEENSDPKGGNEVGERTVVNIAYGTEKRRWLTWAVEEFEKTADGKRIEINLIPMGSLEGARATVEGKEKIHVWSPASGAYKNVFVQDWELKYGGKGPILREEVLALSPMVFVMWKERYEAFKEKYGELSFDTIAEALNEQGGWNGIAAKPEWGFFKFGHTNPNESNSGMLSLVLMAYHYHQKVQPLQMEDIVDPGFQSWLRRIEKGVTGLSNSTGNMMRDMVLKGPASYDALMVYENVVIDYLRNAEGRWGELYVVYPQTNIWNDNPYYIIDAEWSSEEVRDAADQFLEFLLTKPIQEKSLEHGFRPGDPAVSIKGADSPFVKFAQHGIKVDIPLVCEPPRADAINNLLTGWQRIRN